MAFNTTAAKLLEFTDTKAFEDMCSSLLVSDYPHIIPLGGIKDGGKDAVEPTVIKGIFQSEDGETILQFSTQKSLETKLKRELEKIYKLGHKPKQYVFVTNQDVTSTKKEKLRVFASATYNLPIVIYDLKWLRARLESPDYLRVRRQYLGLDENSLPAFLEVDEYATRRIDRKFAPDLQVFTGRNKEIEQIEKSQKSANKILVINGLPGLGKTKILIEAAKRIEETGAADVKFIRPEIDSLETHFNELDPKVSYLLVLDDAHDFNNLRQLLSLFTSPEFEDKLHLIVATHPWAKDKLKQAFERLGHPCEELNLKPLTNNDISRIVKAPLLGIDDHKAIDAIVTVSEGNPLIAVTAASFLKEKGNLAGLTRHQLLAAYFAGVLKKAFTGHHEGLNLLFAIIAATRGLNPNDPNIRTPLAQTIQVSEGEIDVLVDLACSIGLLKRTWRGVRVVPDLFAEHIVFEAFFSDGHLYDFSEKVISPFFLQAGAEIFKSLAIAETLGGKDAKAVLDQELDNVRSLVKEMNNAQRVAVLNWLKKFAFMRPEDSLLILRSMLEYPSHNPVEIKSTTWGKMEFTISDVFRGATEILRETWLDNESCLRETLSLLYLIAAEQDHSRMHQDPSGNSLRVLTETVVTITPGKDIRVQEITLEEIENWLQANPSQAQQDVIARCLAVILSITWAENEISAIEPNKVTLSRGLLAINENLLAIRRKVLQLLKQIYSNAQPTIRINIISYLDSEFGPYFEGAPGEDLTRMLTEETHEIFSEFERMSGPEAVQERYAIWKVLKRLYDFSYITSLPDCFSRLYTDEVKMFAHLTVWPGQLHDFDIGYKEAAKLHGNYWRDIVRQFSPNDLKTLMAQINRLIGFTSGDEKNAVSANLRIIVSFIAETAPGWLKNSVVIIPETYPNLRRFGSSFLGSLYALDHKLASTIFDNWLSKEDITVQKEACEALLWIDKTDYGKDELRQIEELTDLKDPGIDSSLTQSAYHIKRLELNFPIEAVEILKGIARRCTDSNLINIAGLLGDHEKHEILFLVNVNATDLKELVFNFIRLENLDVGHAYYIEEMLERLFISDFRAWIEFWKARINRQKEVGGDGKYRAVPFHVSNESAYVSASEHRVKVLSTFLEWSAKDEGVYKYNGSQLFKLFSGNNLSAIEDVLDKWLESGELVKLRAVARVLRGMGYNSYFLKMATKLLNKTDDELIQSYLANTVMSVEVMTGSIKTVWETRIKDIQQLIAAPGVPVRVTVFANRLIDSLTRRAELEEDEIWDD